MEWSWWTLSSQGQPTTEYPLQLYKTTGAEKPTTLVSSDCGLFGGIVLKEDNPDIVSAEEAPLICSHMLISKNTSALSRKNNSNFVYIGQRNILIQYIEKNMISGNLHT